MKITNYSIIVFLDRIQQQTIEFLINFGSWFLKFGNFDRSWL